MDILEIEKSVAKKVYEPTIYSILFESVPSCPSCGSIAILDADDARLCLACGKPSVIEMKQRLMMGVFYRLEDAFDGLIRRMSGKWRPKVWTQMTLKQFVAEATNTSIQVKKPKKVVKKPENVSAKALLMKAILDKKIEFDPKKNPQGLTDNEISFLQDRLRGKQEE